MSNMFRVLLTDSVNGDKFNFAVKYEAANANAAGKLAMAEWPGLYIVETKRVV